MAIIEVEEEPTPRSHRTLRRELWEEILKRLQNPLDTVRFRSICNSCRSILPSPLSTSIFPMSIPPPPTVSETYHSYRLFIIETNGYLYRPSLSSVKNPLIVVFESNLPRGTCYPCLLYTPDGKRGRIDNFPKVLDLQQCSIRPLFTAYYVRFAFPATSYNNIDNELKEIWMMGHNSIQKVVLISYNIITNKSTKCNPIYTRIRPELDVGVVVLTQSGKLYFLSSRSMKWESIQCDNMDDIINYGGMLWAIDKVGGAYILDDIKSLVLTQVVGSLPHDDKHRFKRRLVEASGELYMVAPIYIQFEVYKMKRREWVRVKGVGDHIFYVMRGLCFSAVVSNKDGITRNGNVAFVDRRSFGKASRDFAVYDFEKKAKFGVSDDELPEMFCSKYFTKSRKRQIRSTPSES